MVADGLPLRNDIPSLHLSDFEAILSRAKSDPIKTYLIPNAALAFGFVFTPRLKKTKTVDFSHRPSLKCLTPGCAGVAVEL